MTESHVVERGGRQSSSHAEGERTCASCESGRNVRPHPRMASVLLCEQCLDAALASNERERKRSGERRKRGR